MKHVANVLMIIVVVVLTYTICIALLPKKLDKTYEPVKTVIRDTVVVSKPNILDYE